MEHNEKKLCPCCGQDIIVPNEFTALSVPAAGRLMLFKMFRVMPNTISYERFVGYKKTSLMVVIHRLNAALTDIGSKYVVECERGVGYYMNTRRKPNDTL